MINLIQNIVDSLKPGESVVLPITIELAEKITPTYLGGGCSWAMNYEFTLVSKPTGDEIHCQWSNGDLDIYPRDTSMTAEEQVYEYVK